MPNRTSIEQSSTDGSQKKPRLNICTHPVNASKWHTVTCYLTALLAKDGSVRASNKTIRILSQLFNSYSLSILEAMVSWVCSFSVTKWRQERVNLSIDDLVLITDKGIPPLHWSVGRVMQLKLGHNGLARVALVRTLRGYFTRPVNKLRPLRVKDNDPGDEKEAVGGCLVGEENKVSQ